MAKQIGVAPKPDSFEYELFEGDPDHLRTVVATPSQTISWIDPLTLKLKHRIGRGAFGDVWLATHHQSSDDYDENHDVAIKMIHQLKEDHMQLFFDRFEDIFRKSRELQAVCWLHGISIKNGKICIAMKFYEGSVGVRMARLREGKLPLPDVIRYGIELAKGILELHSLGILVLNLKPSNFLLNDQDQVILGDFGIPYLLLGISLSNNNMALRHGTPNYMAPEQWEPEVRGPISFETDAWGFGCSIVEMLTGAQPWAGRSVEEIYNSVVLEHEKPHIPSGLSPAIENVLNGCFEYDLRNRPLFSDILLAFESSRGAVYNDDKWTSIGSRTIPSRSTIRGHTKFLSKDHLQVGDIVRTIKPLNSCNAQNLEVNKGTVVGLEKDTDQDGFVLVRVQGIPSPLRVNVSTLERIISGFAPHDWVRLKTQNNRHSSVGIIHSIGCDESVTVGFLGLKTLWRGQLSELSIVDSYHVGQFVSLKGNIVTPRFNWPRKTGGTGWSTGKIAQILPNGCLLVNFPGKFVFGNENNSFMADPDEVELVSFNNCQGVVKKYQHMEDFHWSVRPVLMAFGLLTALKVGLSVGKNARANVKKGSKFHIHSENHSRSQDGQTNSSSSWLPSPVANIIFREGGSSAAAR